MGGAALSDVNNHFSRHSPWPSEKHVAQVLRTVHTRLSCQARP